MKQFLMGNEAIALGAIHAGVHLIAGYPGTPSTEILETAAKNNQGQYYVEWSVNEKAALEVAAGASYAGARTLVTMKQVGLNVASDPLMSLAYVGVKGGMVIVSADDPGPISSQTEQDTRHFAQFAKLPVFDPSSPEEAYQMVQDAFDYSEQYGTPVLLRPTTRVCHGCSDVTVKDVCTSTQPEGFLRDSQKWVIFPRSSYLNHIKLEERYPTLALDFSGYWGNRWENKGTAAWGIACSGISYAYVKEALDGLHLSCPILKISTAYPFPEPLALEFLSELKQVLVFEELDPVVEKELLLLCGREKCPSVILGKLTGHNVPAGENSAEAVKQSLRAFLHMEQPEQSLPVPPSLPVRPPVLCAGCPHRASFYAVKKAMEGRKAVFAGDIGCYTLGNAQPLDMVDTCLCMGADVTIAQGLHRVEPDTVHFSFIGDSTFFASGITGVINAAYNETDLVLVVLDNSTTAMTGHQPHPGTGVTMMGEVAQKISIRKILEAIGATVYEADPLCLDEAIETVRRAADGTGVRAILFRSPCIAVSKPKAPMRIADACINCKKCIRELGCPALVLEKGAPVIEPSLCFGCGLCSQICPVHAIKGGEK